MLKLFGESPKNAGTRKMAAKLALRGHAVTSTEVHSREAPYCDDPPTVVRTIRAAGHNRGMEVSMLAPCRKCSKCLQYRQLMWRDRAIAEIHQAPRSWWVTLTFDPPHLAGIMAEASQSRFKGDKALDHAAYRHLQRYLKRLRKASRRKFRYCAVFEKGEKNGRAHYHLFIHEVDGPIGSRSIDGCWRSIVHCRLVREGSNGLASYVTKYATKSLDIRIRASVRYGQITKPSLVCDGNNPRQPV